MLNQGFFRQSGDYSGMGNLHTAENRWREGSRSVAQLHAEFDALQQELKRTGPGNRVVFQKSVANLKSLAKRSRQLNQLLEVTRLLEPHHPYHFTIAQSLKTVETHTRSTHRRLCQAAMKDAVDSYDRDAQLSELLSLGETLSISLGELRKMLHESVQSSEI